MRLLLAVVFASFLVPVPSAAQGGLAYDSSDVEARPIPEATLQRLAEDPAFQYERGSVAVEGIWSRVWRWLSTVFLEPTLSRVPPGLVAFLTYAVIAAILVFAAIRLFSSRVQGGLARSSPRALDAALAEEGIEEVDLQRWLDEALAERRHREAVRIHFLITLKDLSAAGLITWSPEKTNRAYLEELRGTPIREPLAVFSQLFERVWYGHAPAGPAEVEAAAGHVAVVQARLERSLEPA